LTAPKTNINAGMQDAISPYSHIDIHIAFGIHLQVSADFSWHFDAILFPYLTRAPVRRADLRIPGYGSGYIFRRGKPAIVRFRVLALLSKRLPDAY